MFIDMIKRHRKFTYYALPFLIIVASFLIYVIGFDWGKTSIFQPDESKLVEPLRQMVESKTLIHNNWAYPAQASTKVLAFILTFVNRFVAMRPIEYYFVNRFFYAVIGAGSVLVTWLIVYQIRGYRFATLMTALMAICPLWTQYSKEVGGDIPALFFSLLVLLFAQRYLKYDKVSYLVAMSFFASCAALEKWHGAWTCFYIAIIVLINSHKKLSRFLEHGIISMACFIGGIVLLAPSILTDFNKLLEGLEFVYVYDGTKENPLINTYPNFFFTHLGIVSAIVLLFGLYNAFFGKKKEEAIENWAIYLFSPACLFAFWFMMTRTAFERWGFGIYWGMLFFLVDGIVYFINNKKKSFHVFGLISLILVVMSFATDSLLIDLIAVNTHKDGRIVGDQILCEIGATNDNTLSDYYTPLAPGGIREAGEGVAISFQENGSDFAVEKDGIPYMKVPGIKYVVTGGYYGSRNNDGYLVVKEHGTYVTGIESGKKSLCIFERSPGSGAWSLFEGDTIRRNINDIRIVLNSDIIGPSFSVYDVSSFVYMQ